MLREHRAGILLVINAFHYLWENPAIMRTLLVAIALLLCSAPLLAQPIDSTMLVQRYGYMNGNKYVNQHWNFTLQLPESWHLRDMAENRQLVEDALEVMANGNDTERAELNKQLPNLYTLLTATMHEPATATGFNPNIVMLVEHTNHQHALVTANDYLMAATEALAQASITQRIDKKSKTAKLGDVIFQSRTLDAKKATVEYSQELYALAVGPGEFLLIIASYGNKKDRPALMKLLQTFKQP